MEDIIILSLVLGAIIIFIATCVKIIRPTHRGLIERFGKFKSFHNAGLIILIPFVDRLIQVNITEQMVDAKEQEVITKDALNATVDAQIYFKVQPDSESVRRSEYSVNNYYRQIVQLARTTLRDIIGNMTLTQANSTRSTLNSLLGDALQKETNKWGIEVVRTELKEIEPPADVQQTMNDVVKAENTKIAAKDFATATEIKADGQRRAIIKVAEAGKRSTVLEAEGTAEAITTVAKAKAEQIKVVNESAQKYFKDQAVELKKLETAKEVLENNTKIIVPEGADLVNVVGETVGVLPIKKK